jgi:tetratricopeptide (TPR) repeat protein
MACIARKRHVVYNYKEYKYDINVGRGEIKLKKLLCILLISILFISSSITVYSENKAVEVKLNDKLLTFDVPPTSVQGRILVPLRIIFEELGMKVVWEGATKTITGSKDGVTVKLQQDSKTAYVNGNQVTLDVPAQAIKGRILVPVRFIAESTGAKVFWEGKRGTVYISTSSDKTLTLDKIISSSDYANEGYKLGQAGNIDDVIKKYEKAIEIDPFNFNAHYWKGLSLKLINNNEEALKCFDEAIKINPRSYLVHEKRAEALYYLGRYKESAASYEEAVKLDKSKYTKTTFINLGDGLYDDKNYEDSILFYNIVINYYPDEAEYAYYSKAVALHYLLKYDEALRTYDKAIEINPKYADAYNNKGNVYKDLEKQEEALKCYDKAIEIDPEEGDFYYSKGNALYTFKRYDEAITTLNKAVEKDSSNIEAYEKIALTLYDQGKSEEALKSCDSALILNPKSSRLYNTKGNLYYWSKMYKESVEMYDKAIQFFDNKVLYIYSNKAGSLYELERYDEALAAYNKAIELNLFDEDVYNSKGNTLIALGKYEEAIESYNKALELDDKFAVVYFNKAICYIHLDNVTETLSNLKKAFELEVSLKELARTYSDFNKIRTNQEFMQLIN